MERNEIHGSMPLTDATIDFNPVLGLWINSNEKTLWLKQFTLSQQPERIVMRTTCAHEPNDWGEAEVTPYLDNIGERAFSAEYHLAAYNTLLAGNMNKGLWVIAAFYRFKDERPNFLGREFFFRG